MYYDRGVRHLQDGKNSLPSDQLRILEETSDKEADSAYNAGRSDEGRRQSER